MVQNVAYKMILFFRKREHERYRFKIKRKKGRNKMRKKRRCPYCLCESELIERGGKKRNTNKDINKRNKKQHSVQDIKTTTKE